MSPTPHKSGNNDTKQENNNKEEQTGKSDNTTAGIVPYQVQMESNNLPSFWHGNPRLWFKQAELIMASANIKSDERQFNHIVKHLSESQSSLVSDVILNPPPENKFKTLKDALIKRSEESEMRRIQSVLHAVEMGNQSPSSFHRQLSRMAGDSSALSSDLIKKLWVSRLPPTIGAILVGMEGDNIAKLYETADRIWGMNNPFTNPFCQPVSHSHISAINTDCKNSLNVNNTKNDQFDLHELCKSINELKTRFERFENRANQQRFRSRNRSHSRPSSRSRSVNHPMCWYHYKFGNMARKCGKPNCTFKTNENQKN